MTDLDNQLQQRLTELENGAPAEHASANLPADAAELRPLVTLAATVRETPHPLPTSAHTESLQQRLDQASREMRRQEPGLSRRSLNAWLIGSGFAAVALTTICLFLAAVGLWMYGPQQAHAATFQAISGNVEIAPAGANWQQASKDARLSSGWKVRTGPAGSATFAFYDGTQTTLGPDSEVVLTQVNGRWGDVIRVTLDQVAGISTHQVIPFNGKDSQFIVNTPSGQASVHGTTFSVAVDEQGQASFAVDAGEVVVKNADQSVSVLAGQATLSLPDEAPADPVYQFSLLDVLTGVEGDVWTVAGVSFEVSANTILLGDPQVNDIILVRGRILDGLWVADFIQVAPEEDDLTFQFSGVVEAVGEESWVVNGVEILVNEVTEVDGDIEVGDPVRVTYLLLDGGRWLALEIENLSFEVPPTPLPTVANCSGADPQPKAQKLATQYNVPYAEIMGWFCQGFGFGEIDLAYGLSQETGVPVSDIFDLRLSGLGWGEIKRRLHSTPTVTPTAPLTPTLTVTPTLTITPTATLPVTLTPTPVMTVTITPTPIITVTITPPPSINCTGADPHPKAQKLAQQYGVPYEEIMGWFCQGFGFGEIDLAYSLSEETGVPVADIFAMKSSGMGWGEIKKALTGEAGKPKDDDKDKDKGPGPDDGDGGNDDDPSNPGKKPKDKDKNKNKNKP